MGENQNLSIATENKHRFNRALKMLSLSKLKVYLKSYLTSYHSYDTLLLRMSKPYKFLQVTPQILGVKFDNAIDMALMFMRFQEYTEGVKNVRGQFLTEGDVLIHTRNKRKSIYYKEGWLGFNIRGDIFVKIIIENGFLGFNKYELDLFKKVTNTWNCYGTTDFFIIAWVKGDKSTKRHELCHAYYYLNLDYRKRVDTIFRPANLKKAKKHLKKAGYFVKGKKGRYILHDEINAYLMEKHKNSTRKELGITKKDFKLLKKEYKTYVK